MRAPQSTPGRIGKAAATLGLCALLAVALLAGIELLTRERIATARAEAARQALARVLPGEVHDNDLAADRIEVQATAWLGVERPLSVWRARRAGQPAALVLQAIAVGGYAGPIELLVGVTREGRISGVRVVTHRETPGLGDPIEAERSDWILGFAGRSLVDPSSAEWAVKKDGGEFDQFVGATITPRAVVRAVRHALEYAKRHGDALYAAPVGSTLEHDDAP